LQPFVRIYSVPPTEFESEDEESDEEEDSSDNEGKPDGNARRVAIVYLCFDHALSRLMMVVVESFL
jgi:hypothetical protein